MSVTTLNGLEIITADQGEPGWRCPCSSYVLANEIHRCFYAEALKHLERISLALDKIAHSVHREPFP